MTTSSKNWDKLSPASSAIFTLVRQATPDKVIEEIAAFGGKVLRTSLSKEDEAKLQEALNRGNAYPQRSDNLW